jgi:hypothetical protein
VVDGCWGVFLPVGVLTSATVTERFVAVHGCHVGIGTVAHFTTLAETRVGRPETDGACPFACVEEEREERGVKEERREERREQGQ